MNLKLFYKIVIGDSRSMKEIEDESVHLVITSPPYWFLVKFSKPGEPGWKDDLSWCESKEEFFEELGKVWSECYRVLIPGGYLACEWEDIPIGSEIYGYPREICLCGDMVKSIEESGLYLISRWFWKKFEGGAALSKFAYVSFSHIKKHDPRAIANLAYLFVFKKKGLRRRRWSAEFTKEDWGDWLDSLWRIENPSITAEGIASGAVFPDELVRRLILLSLG